MDMMELTLWFSKQRMYWWAVTQLEQRKFAQSAQRAVNGACSHGFGGCHSLLSIFAKGGEQQRWVPVRFPVFL